MNETTHADTNRWVPLWFCFRIQIWCWTSIIQSFIVLENKQKWQFQFLNVLNFSTFMFSAAKTCCGLRKPWLPSFQAILYLIKFGLYFCLFLTFYNIQNGFQNTKEFHWTRSQQQKVNKPISFALQTVYNNMVSCV